MKRSALALSAMVLVSVGCHRKDAAGRLAELQAGARAEQRQGAQAETRRARAMLAQSKVIKEFLEIRAPYDALVIHRLREPGSIIGTGQAVLTIARLDQAARHGGRRALILGEALRWSSSKSRP